MEVVLVRPAGPHHDMGQRARFASTHLIIKSPPRGQFMQQQQPAHHPREGGAASTRDRRGSSIYARQKGEQHLRTAEGEHHLRTMRGSSGSSVWALLQQILGALAAADPGHTGSRSWTYGSRSWAHRQQNLGVPAATDMVGDTQQRSAPVESAGRASSSMRRDASQTANIYISTTTAQDSDGAAAVSAAPTGSGRSGQLLSSGIRLCIRVSQVGELRHGCCW